MLGLNFYGMDFNIDKETAEPIIGKKYIQVLEEHEPKLRWDPTDAEHFLKYYAEDGSEHEVWYPSLMVKQADLFELLLP